MRVAIGFGANLGDRGGTVRAAVRDVGIIGEVVAISSLYRSAPVGGPEQADYLNGVVIVETDLEPSVILAMTQGIEQRHGRLRAERWGPRTLDMDLLVFEGTSVDSRTLTVPHPRASQRRFVLEPLTELWPNADIGDQTAESALAGVADQDVSLVAKAGWQSVSEKGGRWVAAQGVLFVLLVAFAIFDVDSLGTSARLPWIGRALVVLATVEMWFGIRHLGSNLTAFPEPTESGILVASGIFSLVRHPLYGANVLIFLGVALHQRSLLGLLLGVVAAGFFWTKSSHEESRLMMKYPSYHAYRMSVPRRLLPWIL